MKAENILVPQGYIPMSFAELHKAGTILIAVRQLLDWEEVQEARAGVVFAVHYTKKDGFLLKEVKGDELAAAEIKVREIRESARLYRDIGGRMTEL